MSDVSSFIAPDSIGRNVFKGLSKEELDRIMRRATRLRVAAKAPIFQIGDRAENVLMIESGRVRTIYTAADGQEYTTGIWSRGYAVGLISAIMASRRILSVEAIDDVSLLALPIADLEKVIVECPAFARNLMEALAFMASSGITRATKLATKSVQARLAAALMAVATLPESMRTGHSAEIVGISHEEWARLVSTTRPWVTQALSDLQSQGLIVSYRMRIVIPDVRRLRGVRY